MSTSIVQVSTNSDNIFIPGSKANTPAVQTTTTTAQPQTTAQQTTTTGSQAPPTTWETFLSPTQTERVQRLQTSLPGLGNILNSTIQNQVDSFQSSGNCFGCAPTACGTTGGKTAGGSMEDSINSFISSVFQQTGLPPATGTSPSATQTATQQTPANGNNTEATPQNSLSNLINEALTRLISLLEQVLGNFK